MKFRLIKSRVNKFKVLGNRQKTVTFFIFSENGNLATAEKVKAANVNLKKFAWL